MQSPLQHMFVEIRPSLQSVNIYAVFSEDIASQCKIELTRQGFNLIYGLRKHSLQFFDEVDKENLVILSARRNYLVFRFSISYASVRGSLKAEILNLDSDIKKLQLNDVTANEVSSIRCSNGCVLNCQDIKRAFKSPHFDYEPNEWFCHAHNVPDYSVKPNLCELQITDYGYYIDKKMVEAQVNNENKLLKCKECSTFLGKEIFEGIYKFYPDTVYICSPKKTDTELLQIDTLSMKYMSSDSNGASVRDKSLASALKIIGNAADRNLGKVILTCHASKVDQKEYILIWVIEKNLLTYRMFQGGTLTSSYLNKVLFQHEYTYTATVDQWCKDFNTVLIDISPSMMHVTVNYFVEMNNIIPEEYRSANGFLVSFIKGDAS